jgi:hypothetical protein
MRGREKVSGSGTPEISGSCSAAWSLSCSGRLFSRYAAPPTPFPETGRDVKAEDRAYTAGTGKNPKEDAKYAMERTIPSLNKVLILENPSSDT